MRWLRNKRAWKNESIDMNPSWCDAEVKCKKPARWNHSGFKKKYLFNGRKEEKTKNWKFR